MVISGFELYFNFLKLYALPKPAIINEFYLHMPALLGGKISLILKTRFTSQIIHMQIIDDRYNLISTDYRPDYSPLCKPLLLSILSCSNVTTLTLTTITCHLLYNWSLFVLCLPPIQIINSYLNACMNKISSNTSTF